MNETDLDSLLTKASEFDAIDSLFDKAQEIQNESPSSPQATAITAEPVAPSVDTDFDAMFEEASAIDQITSEVRPVSGFGERSSGEVVTDAAAKAFLGAGTAAATIAQVLDDTFTAPRRGETEIWMERVTGRPPIKEQPERPIRSAIDAQKAEWSQMIEMLPVSDSIQGMGIMEGWSNPRWWVENSADVAAQLAVDVAVSKGAGTLSNLSRIGNVAFMTLSGGRMASDAYDDAYKYHKENGLSDQAARSLAASEAAVTGLIGSAISELPGNQYFQSVAGRKALQEAVRRNYGRIGGAIAGGWKEPVEEMAQELSSMVTQSAFRPDSDAFDGALDRILTAGALSVGPGAVAGFATSPEQSTTTRPDAISSPASAAVNRAETIATEAAQTPGTELSGAAALRQVEDLKTAQGVAVSELERDLEVRLAPKPKVQPEPEIEQPTNEVETSLLSKTPPATSEASAEPAETLAAGSVAETGLPAATAVSDESIAVPTLEETKGKEETQLPALEAATEASTAPALTPEQSDAVASAGARVDADASEMLGYPAIQVTITDPGRESALYVSPNETPEQISAKIQAKRDEFIAAENQMMSRVLSGTETESDRSVLERAGLVEVIAGEPVLTDAGNAQLPADMRPSPEIEVVAPPARRRARAAGRRSADIIAEAVAPLYNQLIERARRAGVSEPEIVASKAIDRVMKLRRNRRETPDALAERAAKIANSIAIRQAITDGLRSDRAAKRDRSITTSTEAPISDTATIADTLSSTDAPVEIEAARSKAQQRLDGMSVLDRAALTGSLLQEDLISRQTAYEYIRAAIESGETEASIRDAIQGATARWTERSSDLGDRGQTTQGVTDSRPSTSVAGTQPNLQPRRTARSTGGIDAIRRIQSRIQASQPMDARGGGATQQARLDKLESYANKLAADLIKGLPDGIRSRVRLEPGGKAAQVRVVGNDLVLTPFRADYIGAGISNISDADARRYVEFVVDEEIFHAIDFARATQEADAQGVPPDKALNDRSSRIWDAVIDAYNSASPDVARQIEQVVISSNNLYFPDHAAQGFIDFFASDGVTARSLILIPEMMRQFSQIARTASVAELEGARLLRINDQLRDIMERSVSGIRDALPDIQNQRIRDIVSSRVSEIDSILQDAYTSAANQNVSRHEAREQQAISELESDGLSAQEARATQRRIAQAKNPAHQFLLEDIPQDVRRAGERLIQPGIKYALWRGMMIADHGEVVRPMLPALWDAITKREHRGAGGWRAPSNRIVVERAAMDYFGGVLPASVQVRYYPNTNTKARIDLDTGIITLNAAILSADQVPSALEHEMGHLIYNSEPEVRESWNELWNELTPESQARINEQVEQYYSGQEIQEEERVVRALQLIRDEARNKPQNHPLRQAWERFIAAIVRAWRRLTGQTPDINAIADSIIEAARARVMGAAYRAANRGARYSYVDTSSFTEDSDEYLALVSDDAASRAQAQAALALPVGRTLSKLARAIQLVQQTVDRRGNPAEIKVSAVLEESLYKGDDAENLADILSQVTALTYDEALVFAERAMEVQDLSIRIIQSEADAVNNSRTGHAIALSKGHERRDDLPERILTPLERAHAAVASADLIAEQLELAYNTKDRDSRTAVSTTRRQIGDILRTLSSLARQTLRNDPQALRNALRIIATATTPGAFAPSVSRKTGEVLKNVVEQIKAELDKSIHRELAKEARVSYLKAKGKWNTLGDSAQAILSDIIAMFSVDGKLTDAMRERLKRAKDAYDNLTPEQFFVGPKDLAAQFIDSLPSVSEEFKQPFRERLSSATQPGEIASIQRDIKRQMDELGIPVDKATDAALTERLNEIADFAKIDRLNQVAIQTDVDPDVLQTIRDTVEYALAVDRMEKGHRQLHTRLSVNQVAEQSIAELSNKKPITSIINQGKTEKRAGIFGRGLSLLANSSFALQRLQSILRPISPTLSEALYGRIVVDGTIDKIRAEEQLVDPVWDALAKSGHPRGSKALQQWLYEPVSVMDGTGAERKMLRSELWSIALSARNEYNLKAMVRNGVVINRQRGSGNDRFQVDSVFLQNMDDALTNEDRMVIHAISEQFNGRMRTMLSSTLRNMGKPFEIVENYFPIKTDWITREAGVPVNTTMQEMVNQSLTGAGFLKSRTGIRAAVEIGDALDTFLNHSNRSASIYAYLEPFTAAQKLLNRADVKQSLARVIGEEGTRIVQERLEAHVMPPSVPRNLPNRSVQAIVNRAAPVTLALSLGATFMNFSSLPLAAAQVQNGRGMQYLVRAAAEFRRSPRQQFELLMQYSPAARERYNEFANQMSSGLIDYAQRRYTKTLAEKSMFTIEFTDKVNAVVRFNMAQQYIRDTRPDLTPGTPEFYAEAAREWTQLTFQTENSSHTGDATGILLAAKESPFLGAMTVFTSAPSKILSMLLEAASEAQQGNSSKALRFAGGVASSIAFAALVRAVIDSVAGSGAFGDDEEDEEKTYGEKMGSAYLRRGLSEALGIVPIIGSIADSLLARQVLGEPGIQRSGNYALDIVTSFSDSINAWSDAVKKWDDVQTRTGEPVRNEQIIKALEKSALPAGLITRTPIPGVARLAKIGARMFESAFGSSDDAALLDAPRKQQESASQESARFVNAVEDGDTQAFVKTWRAYKEKRPEADYSDAVRLVNARYGSNATLFKKQEESGGKISDEAVDLRIGQREAALNTLDELANAHPELFE